MNINDIIVKNILLKLDAMNNDDTFKERCPGILAQEYLYAKVHNDISLKRFINILNGKAKLIKTNELISISKALKMHLSDLVKY